MATAKPKKKKKSGRRLRKGRVAGCSILFLGIVALLLVAIVKCATTEHIVIYHNPDVVAIKHGREDAMKVLQTQAGTMERQSAILHIKSQESKLRLNGYNHSADDYIKAVNDYLEKHKVIYDEL